jgi:co-chaperonin GroES (HSP10)
MIQPFRNKIQLEISEPSAGALDLSSKPTVVEVATVVAIGKDVKGIEVGDKIMVKGWSLDVINFNNKNYYFTNFDGDGICAIIKE